MLGRALRGMFCDHSESRLLKLCLSALICFCYCHQLDLDVGDWRVGKPARPPFGSLSVECTKHSKNLIRLGFSLLTTNHETWGNKRSGEASPYWFFFFQGEKDGESTLELAQRSLPAEALCGHPHWGPPCNSINYRGAMVSELLIVPCSIKWVSKVAVATRTALATHGALWQVQAERVQGWEASTRPQELFVPSWGPSAAFPQWNSWKWGGGIYFFRAKL